MTPSLDEFDPSRGHLHRLPIRLPTTPIWSIAVGDRMGMLDRRASARLM
jgi:hypothetical protein